MAKKKLNHGQVIIPTGHPNPPEPHEIEAAWILARHFDTTIEFLIPLDDYLRKMLLIAWFDRKLLGTFAEIRLPDLPR